MQFILSNIDSSLLYVTGFSLRWQEEQHPGLLGLLGPIIRSRGFFQPEFKSELEHCLRLRIYE